MNFIKHSDFATQKSSLIYFSGILGFNVNLHQWLEPFYYTQILAGLQFCMRLLLLEHALPQDHRNDLQTADHNPLERFRAFHRLYLVEGKEYPFNYIHKLLNYGWQASKNSTTRSRLRWSADNTVLHYDGYDLVMSDWKEFVLNLLTEAENMCSTELLFQSDGRLPHVMFKDNPNARKAGDFFGTLQPDALNKGRKYICENLKRWKNKDKMLNTNATGPKFHKAGVDQYEKSVRKFKKLLCVLMMVTCGQTGRGSELTSLLYMNTINGDRSIYIEDGQIMFVSKYHKSLALMDNLKV